MFEMVNNRRLIFGEKMIGEIPTILRWYGKKRYFLLHIAKKARDIVGLLKC